MSDGLRIYEIVEVSSGMSIVLWPSRMFTAGEILYPAFTVRARAADDTPNRVPHVGEFYQRSSLSWEESTE